MNFLLRLLFHNTLSETGKENIEGYKLSSLKIPTDSFNSKDCIELENVDSKWCIFFFDIFRMVCGGLSQSK